MNGRAIVAVGLGLATGLAGCAQEEAPPPPPVRPVLSVVVEPRDDVAAGFTGTIEPRYSTDLGFRVLGRMVSREVDVGDSVRAGEVLATLDSTALGLSVRQLTAELAKAEAQLVNAAATKQRQEALLSQKAGTQADLDTAEEARASALAAVTRARASLAKAKEQLSYTRIVSDADGIVTAANAEVGQTVQAGQTVITVARAEVREAVVDIPDEIARDIDPGTPFDAVLQIDPDQKASGRVREVAPQADAQTRTRRVRITLDKPPAAFRIGTTITAARREAGLSSIDLPRSALLEAEGKTFVWVVDEKARTVSRRPIEIAGESDTTLRIKSGIEVGTRVVTAGVNTLTDGQAVKIQEELVP